MTTSTMSSSPSTLHDVATTMVSVLELTRITDNTGAGVDSATSVPSLIRHVVPLVIKDDS